MTEAWRAVPGFEGEYEVSNLGRVKSLSRTIPYVDGRDRTIRSRILKQIPDSYGYMQVGMGRRKYRVHILVLEAFVGPRPTSQSQGRHLNDVKTDNTLGNLSWGSRSQNLKDRVSNGIHHYSKRTACVNGHPYVAGSFKWRIRKNTKARVCLICERSYRSKPQKDGPGGGGMSYCEICGGSGVLNIEEVGEQRNFDTGVAMEWSPGYAAPCHACPNGAFWKDIGLGS